MVNLLGVLEFIEAAHEWGHQYMRSLMSYLSYSENSKSVFNWFFLA
jgi:hypothetical protein